MVGEIRPDYIAIHERDTERVGNVVRTGEGDFSFTAIVITESKHIQKVSTEVILSMLHSLTPVSASVHQSRICVS